LLLTIPHLVPRDMVQHYSCHSFRIYLACALLAVGATPETIKLMVRWASDEALQIYARLNVSVDADLRASATTARVHSVRSSTMAASAVPEWAEQPDAAERARRSALRAAAAGAADVAAVDRARLPSVDLHDRMHALHVGHHDVRVVAVRGEADMADRAGGSGSDTAPNSDCE